VRQYGFSSRSSRYRQGRAALHDLKPTVRIVADDHLLAGQALRKGARIEDEQHLVVAQRQGLRQRADFLATHRAVQVLMLGEGTVHVLRIAWFLAEPGIEIGGELGRIGIGRLDHADAAKAQFLHKPVLQRLIGALDATFCLRGVGANDVDVELIERATELCQAGRSMLLRTMRRAENPVLVAVE